LANEPDFAARRLVIDSATENCSVALFEGDRLLAHQGAMLGRGVGTLAYSGKELANERTVADFNLVDGSVLRETQLLPGGVKVVVAHVGLPFAGGQGHYK
jgi:hypothetical protein